MELDVLPQFTVVEVRPAHADGIVDVVGRFSHLRGVHNIGGYLYRQNGPSIVGEFDALPHVPGVALVFRTPDATLAPELVPSAVYPWVDQYWRPAHVAMILAGPLSWERRRFTAVPAHYFRQAGVVGWQLVGTPLPDGAEDLGVREGAWDHEHCELCRAHVGGSGAAVGYANADDDWLCERCFDQYASRRDVSFAAEV
jgi:hypothetical protein